MDRVDLKAKPAATLRAIGKAAVDKANAQVKAARTTAEIARAEAYLEAATAAKKTIDDMLSALESFAAANPDRATEVANAIAAAANFVAKVKDPLIKAQGAAIELSKWWDFFRNAPGGGEESASGVETDVGTFQATNIALAPEDFWTT